MGTLDLITSVQWHFFSSHFLFGSISFGTHALEWLAKKVFLVMLPENSQGNTSLLSDSRYSTSTILLHYEPLASWNS